MRIPLAILMLAFVGASQALANPLNDPSIEERAQLLRMQLADAHDYHALLAKELAAIAEAEKGQHDIRVANIFMEMAEQHAAKAGGEQ